MNFLYIHTHDSGRFMQPYGIGAENPGLMELAQEGVLFRNMFCEAPTCSPSRSAMLTGTYAHCCQMLGLAHRGFSLNDPGKHLAAYLSANGYHSELIGIYHECPEEELHTLGYNKWTDIRGRNNTETDFHHLELAKDFLRNASEMDKPFFLSFGLLNTHRDFPKGDHSKADFVVPPYPIPDTPDNRRDWCDYLESLSQADHCVAEVIDTLKETGLWDNTVVLFTTDHGPAYPNMKCNLYDTGMGVAFILRIPGVAHKCVDAMCTQLDLYPTVCDLLGLQKPDWLQGCSLMPLIEGNQQELHDYVYGEITFHASYEPARCIRSKEYKLIRFYDGGEQRRFPNVDDSDPKKLFFSRRMNLNSRPKELFFDLLADPLERVNLVDDPAYREEYLRHASALDEWMKETDDPMARGENMYSLGKGKRTTDQTELNSSGLTYIIE